MLAKLLLILFAFTYTISLFVVSAELVKRPSWSIGRSIDESEEEAALMDKPSYGTDRDNWVLLSHHLDKKPSWAVGRDLSNEELLLNGEKEIKKRIIEFKRGIVDHGEFARKSKYDTHANNDFSSVLPLLQRLKEKQILGRSRYYKK
jgi:hypothetical protein